MSLVRKYRIVPTSSPWVSEDEYSLSPHLYRKNRDLYSGGKNYRTIPVNSNSRLGLFVGKVRTTLCKLATCTRQTWLAAKQVEQ